MQHRIVAQKLPEAKRRVVVSPYADLRREVTPVEAIVPALQAVAATAGGATLVLAPQDGAGTGRVGLFRDGDAGVRVRDDLRDVVGDTTYGDAYAASTATLYAEAAKVTDVELWANVEAFRPHGAVGDRATTTLDVLDLQVELAQPHVGKIIAYRWDDYMDQSGLAGQILARHGVTAARPDAG